MGQCSHDRCLNTLISIRTLYAARDPLARSHRTASGYFLPTADEISEDVEPSGPSSRQRQNTGVNRGGLLRPPGSEDVASRYPNAVWVKPDPALVRKLSQDPRNPVPAPIPPPQDQRNPVPAPKTLPQNPRTAVSAPLLSSGSRNVFFTPPLSPGSRNALFISPLSQGSRRVPPAPGNFPHGRRNAFPKPPVNRSQDVRVSFSTSPR